MRLPCRHRLGDDVSSQGSRVDVISSELDTDVQVALGAVRLAQAAGRHAERLAVGRSRMDAQRDSMAVEERNPDVAAKACLEAGTRALQGQVVTDRKSTRLNS